MLKRPTPSLPLVLTWLRHALKRRVRQIGRLIGTPGADRSRPQPTPADPEVAPTPPPVDVERHLVALSDLDAEALRALITRLNEKADRLGCVVFEGRPHAPGVAVIFAGNIERFFMLPVARHLDCRVIYLQDLESGWYQGSKTLPDLSALCRGVLAREIGDQPCLFFGQSSGGYAALAASSFFPDATVVACAPQTFSDAEDKQKINFVGIRALAAPPGLIDLRQALSRPAGAATLRAVMIAGSEAENPYTAHYWMDYLHALRLIDIPGVRLSIVRDNSHVIVHSRLNLFAELLRDLQSRPSADAAEKMGIVDGFLRGIFEVA